MVHVTYAVDAGQVGVVAYVSRVVHAVHMTITITVASRKGGVAKTTTAVHLASHLARVGRTLLVDADPQASALHWSEAAGDHGGLGCTTIGLPVRDLSRRLIDVASGYVHTVIDTPPGSGDTPIIRSAMVAADVVIVPLSPTLLDMQTLMATVDLLAETETDDVRPFGVLLTRVRAGTVSSRETRSALADLEIPVLDSEIPMRESLAFGYGLPINTGEYEPVVREALAMVGVA